MLIAITTSHTLTLSATTALELLVSDPELSGRELLSGQTVAEGWSCQSKEIFAFQLMILFTGSKGPPVSLLPTGLADAVFAKQS